MYRLFDSLFRSRKTWLALAAAFSVAVLLIGQQIPAEEFIDAIVALCVVLTGAMALEDMALKRALGQAGVPLQPSQPGRWGWLRALAVSRKFWLALVTWLTALTLYLRGGILVQQFVSTTIILASAVIAAIAGEDAALKWGALSPGPKG